MPIAPHILAIDLGTSGPKVALVSVDGAVLDCVFEPTTLHLFADGGAEQDPHDWWRAIVAGSRRLMGQHPEAAAEVVAVAVTAQWSGTVPVDRAGAPAMNAMIWMDSRGAPHIAELFRSSISIQGYGVYRLQRFVRVTGAVPGRAGKDPIAHIIWLRQNRPEVYERTHKFLEPKDYLNFKLTGRFIASYESITLYWLTDNRDLSRVRYDDTLLRWSGIDREKLPDLEPAGGILGPILPSVAAELGIPPTAQVTMGTPDVHSAVLGSGAVADFATNLCIGTSSFITCHVPDRRDDLLHSMASVPSALPGRYLVSNTQETAGVCLTHLLEKHFYPEDELALGSRPADAFARLDRAVAQVPPGADKLIFTPWLFGERTPVEDSTLRGGFFNYSLKTTRRHAARAVLEGVAFNSRWTMGYFEKVIGQRVDSLVLIGGGARSDQWCQIHADVLGCVIRQVADPVRSNALGVAFLASMALGHLKLGDLPSRVPIAGTWEPNSAHRGLYDELFGTFLEIYRRNRKIYARLNRRQELAR